MAILARNGKRLGHRSAEPGKTASRLGSVRKASFPHRIILYWMAFAAILAVGSAAISIWFTLGSQTNGDREGIRFNLLAIALGLALSIGLGIGKPGWWRRGMALFAIAPVPILLLTSHNLAAGAATLLMLFTTSWLGREIARKGLGGDDVVAAWVVGATVGLILLATYGFTAGLAHALRPALTWPLLGSCLAVLVATARTRLQQDIRTLAAWLRHPAKIRWPQLFLAGATLACVWLNLIGALAPEIRPDAVRQRLVTAVQFARNGNLEHTDPDLYVATAPALGEITYATLLTISPVQGAKFLHFLIGLLCMAAVFALGRHMGGLLAGGMAAFAFYATVMIAYLSQTAYLDLLLTLFGVVATLIIGGRRPLDHRGAIVAGICIGCAIAMKAHFAYVAIGLGLIAGITALRGRSAWRVITIVAVLTGAAILSATPWLARSYALTGTIAGLSIGATALTSGANEQAGVLLDIKTYGHGRSLGDLLALPLTATLASRDFGGGQLDTGVLGGHVGYMLLGVLPLLIIIRSRWRTTVVFVGMVVATLLWFYTAQYLRYALPIIAALCAVGGSAYVGAWRRLDSPQSRTALQVFLCAIALAGVLIRAQMPDRAHRFAFGLQDQNAFLEEHLASAAAGSYENLRLANSDPTATRILAMYDGARLYSQVRISSPFTSAGELGIDGPDDLIVQRLREGGYSHILVDRSIWVGPTLGWERMRILDEDFLRQHTTLVGGGESSYLYRILPADQDMPVPWAQGHELLIGGDFELGESNIASWVIDGNPTYDRTGTVSHSGLGALHLGPQERISTTVPVRPGLTYLLSSSTASTDGYAYVLAQVEWRDSAGRVIGTARENLPASAGKYHTFSILAAAPANATSATVTIGMISHAAWIDDLSFRTVPPDDSPGVASILP